MCLPVDPDMYASVLALNGFGSAIPSNQQYLTPFKMIQVELFLNSWLASIGPELLFSRSREGLLCSTTTLSNEATPLIRTLQLVQLR